MLIIRLGLGVISAISTEHRRDALKGRDTGDDPEGRITNSTVEQLPGVHHR